MKRMQIIMVVMLFLAFAVLSGCAINNSYQIRDIENLTGGEVLRPSAENQPNQMVEIVETNSDGKKSVAMPTDPYHMLGVLKTRAIEKGKTTAIEGIVPDIRFGEYFPGSVGGKCWAVINDKEFFCQSVLYRLGEDLKFRAVYIIDGEPKETHQARVMALSVLGDFAYDLNGKEYKIDKQIYNDGKARRKFVSEKGTQASQVPFVVGFTASILEWNEYSTPQGILLSPSGTEEIKYIAGINPQYKYFDKLMGTGNFSLKLDPVGMLIGLAQDVFQAFDAPTTGGDYNSVLSRRFMGITFEYMGNLRQALFEKMLAENYPSKKAIAEIKSEKPLVKETAKEKPEVVSQKPKRSLTELEKQLVDLEYSEEVALVLAQKVKQKKFTIEKISCGTRVEAIIKNGQLTKKGRLNWEDSSIQIKAERYDYQEFSLYRFKNKNILFKKGGTS